MSAGFVLGKKSQANLVGVHPDLVKVVHRALELSSVDFSVVEGLRNKDRQAILVAQGKSKTYKSRHLTGHAVDLYPVGNPTPWHRCWEIKQAMFAAGKELGIPLRWGGDWDGDGDSKDETLYDGPHFELPTKYYPA